ncbi:MAG: DUF1844 domain-containing protein [Chthonomonadales bacterium]
MASKKSVKKPEIVDAPEVVPATFGPEEISASEPMAEQKLPSLSIRDRLLMSIDILHQGSWISMGLVADPATGEMKRDLEQARIAIDCVGYLALKVDSQLDDHTRRELKNLVSDLQINFVQQSSHE